MTLSDWLHPRMDGSLHWQQSLAITLACVMVGVPTYLWWRYDAQPKGQAAEAVRRALGEGSAFEADRVLNMLPFHDVMPPESRARTLICGWATVDGVRTRAAVLARTYRRGGLTDIAVITPDRPETARYPGTGPRALEVCAEETA